MTSASAPQVGEAVSLERGSNKDLQLSLSEQMRCPSRFLAVSRLDEQQARGSRPLLLDEGSSLSASGRPAARC